MEQHSTKASAALGQSAQSAPPPSTSFSKWTRAPNASLQGATDADASRRVAASIKSLATQSLVAAASAAQDAANLPRNKTSSNRASTTGSEAPHCSVTDRAAASRQALSSKARTASQAPVASRNLGHVGVARHEAAASLREASARTRPHLLKKRFASFTNEGRMIGESLSSLRTTGAVSSFDAASGDASARLRNAPATLSTSLGGAYSSSRILLDEACTVSSNAIDARDASPALHA
mmetsp:Transcript_3444/g.10617  ORF Transcript_3444/g.10617 Transcript_3444/m.10617 type:complete len:236 (-) Transcript_3444:374-1081(-)